jgi:hypothetical protein
MQVIKSKNIFVTDNFYIKHKVNHDLKFKDAVKICHLKNFELTHIKRSEFNLCGIFGVPVKMNILSESSSKTQILCRFPAESLQTLEKNIPTNKHIFFGFRE